MPVRHGRRGRRSRRVHHHHRRAGSRPAAPPGPGGRRRTRLDHHGQQITIEALKAKSDFWIEDCDVYFPYDGFSIITLNWIENAGWCGRGEAGEFLAQHWDEKSQRVLIDGRIPINPHGGSLSEGGTQGSGHLREAVLQLQGRAGDRQVEGAQRAIVTAGGFFFNAQGVTLHRM